MLKNLSTTSLRDFSELSLRATVFIAFLTVKGTN